MFKKSLVLFVAGIVVLAQVAAQATAVHKPGFYNSEMLSLQDAIKHNFYDASNNFYKESVHVEPNKNAYSYLWPLCGMIQANNEIEKVTNENGLLKNTLRIIKEYYDPAPPAAGYASYIMKYKGGDRFYDDNQWIGIACMDAWKKKPEPAMLNQGKLIYRYMMTGYDTVLNGGIYWQENKKISKNTCSNGPGIILALQLYQATKQKPYLDTALMIYHWTNSKLKAPNGLYYDNISVNGNKIGKAEFSYNTGTMLQSNVYLYEITKDKKYLNEAVSIADSSMNYFYANGKFRDSYWFNAVLLRGYQHLLQHHNDKKYINAFKMATDNALTINKNELGLMGIDKPMDLVPQSGMLEILARLAYLEKTNQL